MPLSQSLSLSAELTRLRERQRRLAPFGERAADALAATGRLWERRLAEGWEPPTAAGSSFPWQMVRVSLAGLVPGLKAAGEWRRRVIGPSPPLPPSPGAAGEGGDRGEGPSVVAHVLAGNTPLLAWPGLAACLLAGSACFVKMSRDETLWPRLFMESLAEIDAELSELIHLDVWPGDDARTAHLLGAADAVIAYGSDAALAALRATTPAGIPFFGYGHALSVGVFLDDGFVDGRWRGFARDILLYAQGGCLSPQSLLAEGSGHTYILLGRALADALSEEVERLGTPPVSDVGVANAVRQARDLALFEGCSVRGDEQIRWTIIEHLRERDLPEPTGHGVVHILPVRNMPRDFGRRLGAARGRISSVGVAGKLTEEVRAAILAEGVSRICAPGEMQAPPLDWPNGGIDLLRELLLLHSASSSSLKR